MNDTKKLIYRLPSYTIIFTCLVLFYLFTFSSSSFAQEKQLSLKQLLLMPDKVTKAHAKIEVDCQKCHLHFDKSNQSPLCLDCHEEIQQDLDSKKRFHSKIPPNKINQCKSCHTEHKGREFDITSLDIDHFDHQKTEFSLKGSHQTLDCEQCHLPENKNFRIKLKKGQCTTCHKDPHQNELKEDCSQCHSEKTWKIEKFDHSKTDFALKDKHQDLSCNACHIQDVAVDIGNKCITCHRAKDKHSTIFGTKCDSCHSEKGWDKTHYDHFKQTEYELLGAHKKASCDACHFQELNPKKACLSCHKNDDVHLGSNGEDCQQCHNNKEWKKTDFNHNKDTEFTLQGAHKKLSCDACHLPSLTERKVDHVRDCIDCHIITDPHNGNLGEKCQNCHQQEQWSKQVTFNHDFTEFPLTGAHQLVVCQSCHLTADFDVPFFDCQDCHSEDDAHQQTLGNKCETCHNSSSWSAWQFNHQKQTDFPLEGAHNNLACDLCHSNELSKPLSPAKACVECHQNDDIHQGSFGRNCQQCHNTDSFYDFQH